MKMREVAECEHGTCLGCRGEIEAAAERQIAGLAHDIRCKSVHMSYENVTHHAHV
jgi:hypothetical protein